MTRTGIHRRTLLSVVQQRVDEPGNLTQENLAGARVVKAFVRSEHETGRFARFNDALTAGTTRVMRLNALVMLISTLLLNVAIVSALWIGDVGVTREAAIVDQITAFVNYLLRTLMSLAIVGMLPARLARGSGIGCSHRGGLHCGRRM